jgi:ubiquinone biosynthesis protein UbiJ
MATPQTEAAPSAAEPSVADASAPPTEAQLAALLEKMAAYVEGEAEVSMEDYRLLQAMNLAAAERYGEMAESATGLVAFAARLQSKCETMLPQLAQIDVLEAQVGELESAVEQLDSYSKRLESKFHAVAQGAPS